MRPPIGPVRTHHAWRPTIGPAIDGGYPRGARTHTRKYSRPTDRAGGVLTNCYNDDDEQFADDDDY